HLIPAVCELLSLARDEVAIVKYVVHGFRSDGVAVDESVLDANVTGGTVGPFPDPAQEQITGGSSDLFSGHADGAERWPHKAGCVNVVRANDRETIRHREPQLDRSVESADRHEVVAANPGCRSHRAAEESPKC